MVGNPGQHGNSFIGMKVKRGKKFYVVISQNGATYDTHFTLKNIETGEEVICGRDKFTIPRKQQNLT